MIGDDFYNILIKEAMPHLYWSFDIRNNSSWVGNINCFFWSSFSPLSSQNTGLPFICAKPHQCTDDFDYWQVYPLWRGFNCASSSWSKRSCLKSFSTFFSEGRYFGQWNYEEKTSMKPAIDDSRNVCKMRKTCEMRNVCTGYLIFLCYFMRAISHVSHLVVEVVIMHQTKRFPRATRDKIIIRENNWIAKRL